MFQRILRVLRLLPLLVAVASPGFAQRQTGSIHGKVLDKERNPLPGAAVSISGTPLMGTRAYVTSETGVFRFAALPPGGYDVRVEMPGFKTQVRRAILVNVGRTTEMAITLEASEVEEEITVAAPAPLVDIQSSKISLNYTARFLAAIPLSRDLYDIQNSIPGAISEGVDFRRTSSILGGTVRSQLYALDGVPMNDPATFSSMANLNVDVYEEIEFALGAHPAEVGQTDSTFINIVTKSGGNSLKGSLATYLSGERFSEDLFTAREIELLGVNPPEKFTGYRDVSVSFGGPFRKDRVRFFVSARGLWWDRAFPETPELRMARLGFPDSPHYDLSRTELMGFAKLTFQATKKARYLGMLHYNHVYEPIYTNSVSAERSRESLEIWDHENAYATTHQVNLVFNQNTYADIRGTYLYRSFPIHAYTPDDYTYFDFQEQVFWGSSDFNDENIRKKFVVSASLTRFQDGFIGANHEFKAGVEFEQGESHRDWYRSNPYYSYWDDFEAGNPYYYSTSSSRGRLRLRTCPAEPGQWDVQDHVRRFSAYVQDSLVSGRLSLNLGLRFDASFQYEPAQSRPLLRYEARPPLLNPDIADPNALLEALTAQFHAQGQIAPFDALDTPYKKVVAFTTLSPRLGAAFDLLGDGTTVARLSLSRYHEPIWSAKYNGGQIFGPATANFYWNDLNRNGWMDLPHVDSYEPTSIPNQDPLFSYYGKLESPSTNEFTAGLEREITKDFKLGLEFIRRTSRNIVDDWDVANGYDVEATDAQGPIWLPFNFIDPGWDGRFGTVDDAPLTVFGLRADRPAPTLKGGNPPEAERKYWAVVFTFDKRMSNRWLLKGSVVYSSFRGNVDPGYSATEGETGMFDTPNSLINAYGPLAFDRPLQLKVMGGALLPYGFLLSVYAQFLSGSPWERTLARVYFPKNYLGFGTRDSYSAVNAESRGSRRGAPVTNVDLRIEKTFRLGRTGVFAITADVFNLGGRSGINLNENPEGILRYDQFPTGYSVSSTYGRIGSVYGVRSVRLGARIEF